MKKLTSPVVFLALILFSTLILPVNCSDIANVDWNQTFGGVKNESAYSVVQTQDGGYVLAGSTSSFGVGTSDVWLVKTDSSGNMEWNKSYGGQGDDIASAIIQADAVFVIAGMTSSFGAGGFDYWLVKVDSAGNLLWNRTFGGTADDFGTSVIQTVDGGYALTGWTNSFGAGGEDLWLVKTDVSGIMVWNQTFGSQYNDEAHGLVQTRDDGYLVCGDTTFSSSNQDALLLKTDSNGHMLWNKTFGGSALDTFLSIVQLGDGSIALAGYTASYGLGSNDAWLTKTDSIGDLQWNKTYGGSSDDKAYALINSSDGGFALAGQTNVDTTNNYWLVKTDSLGSVLWDNINNKAMDNFAYSLLQTKDYGYVLCGTADTENNGQDFLLVKVNSSSSASGFSSIIVVGLAVIVVVLLTVIVILAKWKSRLKPKEQV